MSELSAEFVTWAIGGVAVGARYFELGAALRQNLKPLGSSISHSGHFMAYPQLWREDGRRNPYTLRKRNTLE